MTPQRWRALLFALMVVSVLYAVRPLRGQFNPETLFPHSDKLAHMAFFLGLWLLARRAGYASGWPLAAGLLAYGVLIEVAQSVSPTMRSASFSDLVADGAGIALAWALAPRSGSRSVPVARQPEEDSR